MAMGRWVISKIEIWPLDVPIMEAFVIAKGRLETAQNLVIRLTLGDGSVGFGEIAPFPDVTGEDRVASLSACRVLGGDLLGQSALQSRRLAEILLDRMPSYPAARCGIEMALVDAVARAAGVPLWAWWGGADVRPRETDVTIPICALPQTVDLARQWTQLGFRLIKLKVGKDLDADVHRLEAVHQACPSIEFVVDPNQGFTREEAAAFVKGARRCGAVIRLLEQPVVKEDLESLAALRRDCGVPIAADESVQTLDDLRAVLRLQAVDFVNIKIMKSGVVHALDLCTAARVSHVRLMIGGMVETRLAMGCSWCLVLGLGGFEILDLDTPLLMRNDPVKGGYRYRGPWLHPAYGPGMAVTLDPPSDVVTVE